MATETELRATLAIDDQGRRHWSSPEVSGCIARFMTWDRQLEVDVRVVDTKKWVGVELVDQQGNKHARAVRRKVDLVRPVSKATRARAT